MAKTGLVRTKRHYDEDFALAAPAVPATYPTRELLTAYDAAFRRRFNQPAPIVPGKDGNLAKQLLTRYTLADLTQWIEVFFGLADAFIRKSGYPFAVFAANVGKCITHGKQAQLNDTTLTELQASQQFMAKLNGPSRG